MVFLIWYWCFHSILVFSFYFQLFEVFYILFYQEWTVSWIFNRKFSNWIPTVCPDSLSQNWHCLICYLFIFSWIEIKNRNNIFECFWVLYNLGLGLCWSFVSDVKVCVDVRPHSPILYKYINDNSNYISQVVAAFQIFRLISKGSKLYEISE